MIVPSIDKMKAFCQLVCQFAQRDGFKFRMVGGSGFIQLRKLLIQKPSGEIWDMLVTDYDKKIAFFLGCRELNRMSLYGVADPCFSADKLARQSKGVHALYEEILRQAHQETGFPKWFFPEE